MTDYTTKKLPNLPLLSSGDATGDEDILINQGGTDKRIKSSALINGSAQTFDSILFNSGITAITANTLVWNDNEYTINVVTGLGATIQVGQETLVLVYNNTGSQTDNGKIIHPIGAFESGTVGITYELADASDWEKCQGTLLVVTHDIANSNFGLATRFGKVRDLDTSSFTGAQLWLTDDGLGNFTETKPEFPSYGISMGGAIKIDATNGEIFVSILGTENDTFNDAWDGAIRESFDFLISSNGTVITGSLSNADNTEDLTLIFSDGFYKLDTTPAATIALTAGTDTTPQTNYVYIPKSTKVLTVSTSGFPTDEHCKVAQLELQSATLTQTDSGALRNQNINDHIKKESDNGHILHIAERVRQLNAEHDNGTAGSLTGTTTNGYIQVTSGQVWQMHKQDFPSISMPTDYIRIVNDFTTAYRRTNNLNTITAYSDGSSWSNEWSNIVIWGIVNKSGEPSFIMGNLPSDGYTSEANAIEDRNNYTNYAIPSKFKGVGFLIARFTIKIQGGAITYNSGVGYLDLRGYVPNNTAGGGAGGSGVTSFLELDDTFSSYSGLGGYTMKVNSGETGLEAVQEWESATGGINYAGGNVGIGTNTPSELLHIYSLLSDVIHQIQSGSGISKFGQLNGSGGYLSLANNSNVTKVMLRSYGDSYINIGNIGLGTDSPSYKLDVNGTINSKRLLKAYQTLTSGTAIAMDVESGQNAKVTLAHNATLTLSNLVDGDEGNIIVTQDATGSRTLTISPTPKVINGGSGAITLSTTAGDIDILSYTYDGTTLFINYGKNYD